MKIQTKTLTRIAVLSIIAFVLMFLDFALPIFPAFLKIDISDVPALIGTFAYGPLAGVIIELIKNILITVFKGSQTGFVGEAANFVIGCALVIPAGIIYKRNKDRKNAIIGLAVGVLSMTIVGALANYFILLPLYAQFMPVEAIIEMGSIVISAINDFKTLVLYGITPFNIFKGLIVSIITMLIYKRLSPFLHSQDSEVLKK
jgi:riboflavin transporter FmnP